MSEMHEEVSKATYKGILGVVSTFGAGTVSFLGQIETWLRIFSLLIGITVGIMTGISLFRTMIRKERRDKQRPEYRSSTSSAHYIGLAVTFLLLIQGCSALVPSEKQKSQSVAATESLATQQSMTIRRALESGPSIARQTVQTSVPTAPRDSGPGYGQKVSPGRMLPMDEIVSSTPIREQLEITTSNFTDAGTHSTASGSLMTSIPMGVKIALIGVGLIFFVVGGKLLWSSIKTTAIGQGIAAGDQILAEMIRAKRTHASATTDPTTLAGINAQVAEMEAARGRLPTVVVK